MIWTSSCLAVEISCIHFILSCTLLTAGFPYIRRPLIWPLFILMWGRRTWLSPLSTDTFKRMRLQLLVTINKYYILNYNKYKKKLHILHWARVLIPHHVSYSCKCGSATFVQLPSVIVVRHLLYLLRHQIDIVFLLFLFFHPISQSLTICTAACTRIHIRIHIATVSAVTTFAVAISEPWELPMTGLTLKTIKMRKTMYGSCRRHVVAAAHTLSCG